MLLDCIKAFLVGGGICVIGQILIDYTKLTPARILVTFVVTGVILGALGIYEPIVQFAGAGGIGPFNRVWIPFIHRRSGSCREKWVDGCTVWRIHCFATGVTAAILFAF